MMAYQIFTASFSLICAAIIIILVRKNMLYTRFTVWWLGITACILAFGFYPKLSDILAKFLSINYPPILILTGAIVLIFIKILFMDLERSRQEEKIRRLVQRVAILQARLREEKKLHDAPDTAAEDCACKNEE